MKYQNIPKIDLHLHLDGCVLPQMLLELAEKQGVKAPAEDLPSYFKYIERCSGCGSVNEYLKMFDLPVDVMQDTESIARITKELIDLIYSQHLAYAEIRFAPQLHTKKGLTQAQAV